MVLWADGYRRDMVLELGSILCRNGDWSVYQIIGLYQIIPSSLKHFGSMLWFRMGLLLPV